MYAKKLNKVYEISSEQEAVSYLERGYDICDDAGNIVKHNPSKTVSYSEFEALQKENAHLREMAGVELQDLFPAITVSAEGGAVHSLTPVTLEEMNVEQLKDYAQLIGADIGNATSQAGILKKIKEAESAPDTSEEVRTLGTTTTDTHKMGGGAAVITASSEGSGDMNGADATADSSN